MLERAIIADDLTGALDAAAPFAMRGISTAVALTPQALPRAIATGARVVGVSTDSRDMAPEDATAAVRETLAGLPAGTALFKKVDSRLKGNIEAELDAIAHRKSLVVPAIPAFGRWMKNGRIGGFGIAEPIGIAGRLGRHAAKASMPNIADQADIEAALHGDFDLPVGARGLAEAMAKAMAPNAPGADIFFPGGPAYCVIGSTDPITLAQLDRLRAGPGDISYVPAPNGQGATPLRPARLTIVQAIPASSPADGKSVAAALGQTLKNLSPPPGSLLVLTGGATAQLVLAQLGISVLELLGEALPGLPIARAGDLTVVTKSGGFGDPNTLSTLFAPYLSAGSLVQSHVR
ncbi:MAG TPA: four-carbon acid sugar kinase family protein [Devosia sp.]|nr:four-carbon acid sugar kinase family protein [Devosia sp.]